MKLFPKLACLVSVLLLGAIASVSTLYYWTQEREIRQELRTEEDGVLQNLVHMAQESFVSNDDLLLVKYTTLLPKWNPAIMAAEFVRPDGHILAHSEPGRIGHPSQEEDHGAAFVLVLRQSVKMGAGTIGTAQLSFSAQRLEDRLQVQLAQLRRRVGIIGLGALLMGLLGSFILARSWTRPIQKLDLAAKNIGQGKWQLDFGSMEFRRDELGHLSTTFRRMAAELQELDQMKEDFVAAVTHELRSPLSAI